jgi:hypothetical protein
MKTIGMLTTALALPLVIGCAPTHRTETETTTTVVTEEHAMMRPDYTEKVTTYSYPEQVTTYSYPAHYYVNSAGDRQPMIIEEELGKD